MSIAHDGAIGVTNGAISDEGAEFVKEEFGEEEEGKVVEKTLALFPLPPRRGAKRGRRPRKKRLGAKPTKDSGVDGAAEMIELARWASRWIGVVEDDVSALKGCLVEGASGTSDSRLRVIGYRLALLHAVARIVANSGSWGVLKDALATSGTEVSAASRRYDELYCHAVATDADNNDAAAALPVVGEELLSILEVLVEIESRTEIKIEPDSPPPPQPSETPPEPPSPPHNQPVPISLAPTLPDLTSPPSTPPLVSFLVPTPPGDEAASAPMDVKKEIAASNSVDVTNDEENSSSARRGAGAADIPVQSMKTRSSASRIVAASIRPRRDRAPPKRFANHRPVWAKTRGSAKDADDDGDGDDVEGEPGCDEDVDPRVCEFCGRTFKAITNLRVHVKNVHGRVRKFPCDQCEKQFVTRYLLLEHQKADHEGLPCHLCPICGKGFTHLTGLKHHQLSAHEFKQERKCLTCDRVYSESCQRSGHDRGTKWNEKALSCPFCDFRCCLKTALQKHIDCCHLKLRPYVCPKCGKAFSYKAHQQRHTEVVHEKVKKHVCSECGRAFGRGHHLKYHIASVHDKRKDFVCEFCEQRFSERRRLKIHVTTSHKDVSLFEPPPLETVSSFVSTGKSIAHKSIASKSIASKSNASKSIASKSIASKNISVDVNPSISAQPQPTIQTVLLTSGGAVSSDASFSATSFGATLRGVAANPEFVFQELVAPQLTGAAPQFIVTAKHLTQ